MSNFDEDFDDDENFGLGPATGDGFDGFGEPTTGQDAGPADSSGPVIKKEDTELETIYRDVHTEENAGAEAWPSSAHAFQKPPSAKQPPAVPPPAPPAHPPPAGGSSQTLSGEAGSSVVIAGLQWWTSDADLEALCGEYGQVVAIKFNEERSNGKSKGSAVVEFMEPDAAQTCRERLNGRDINGKPCMVSFPSGDGRRNGLKQGGYPQNSSGGRGAYGNRMPQNPGPGMVKGRGRYGLPGMGPGMPPMAMPPPIPGMPAVPGMGMPPHMPGMMHGMPPPMPGMPHMPLPF